MTSGWCRDFHVCPSLLTDVALDGDELMVNIFMFHCCLNMHHTVESRIYIEDLGCTAQYDSGGKLWMVQQ